MEKNFSEKDISTARAGGDKYYWGAAREAVRNLDERMTLADLINRYCIDTDLAHGLVTDYLRSLPSHTELVARAFILYTLLVSTRDELARILGIEHELLAEAARGSQNKPVDDEAIRESAGYDKATDRNVAESSKTDSAAQYNITDDDIGGSALEGVTYQDRTAHVSPVQTFLQETKRLMVGICGHCAQNYDVFLLEQAGIIKENPGKLTAQILAFTDRLTPPRDEDR